MLDNRHSPRKSHVLFLIALALTTCLALAAPAFATEPEEADPDPGGLAAGDPTVRVLTLNDPTDLDPSRLEPGRYLIRVIDADGSHTVFEVVVKR